MSDEQTTKPRLATLDDLKSAVLNVEIELEDGDVVLLPFKMPTYFEVLDMESRIPMPEAPINGVDKQGKPVRNFADPSWQAQVNKVTARRNMTLIARNLKIQIPGDTENDKTDWIQENLGAVVMRQLQGLIDSVIRKGEARIEGRAMTFHEEGTSED